MSRRRGSSVRGCTIPDCDGTMFKAGYCAVHWQALFVGAEATTTTTTTGSSPASPASPAALAQPAPSNVAPPPAATVGKGTITFTVAAARNLPSVNKLAPYGSNVHVTCQLGVLANEKWRRESYTTKTINNTNDPDWNALEDDSQQRVQATNCFTSGVKNTAAVNTLRCTVYAKRTTPLPNTVLGTVDIDLVSLPKNILVDDWYPLTDDGTGDDDDESSPALHVLVEFETERVTKMERAVEKTKAGLVKGVTKTMGALKKMSIKPFKKSGI